jgi:hypothetical protein
MSDKGSVIVNFTIGFGNNIFQYCFARIMAERLGFNLLHGAIPELGIKSQVVEVDKSLKTHIVSDANAKLFMDATKIENCNLYVQGYFEDYTYYVPHVEKIRSWFPVAPITNNKDLILHLRLQNRLVQQSHLRNHVLVDTYINAIKQFDYDRLHIVTDAEKWNLYGINDIEKIRYQISIGPNPASSSPWVEVKDSLFYINQLIEGLNTLQPVLHLNGAEMIEGSGGLRDNFMGDFNLIKSFDKVMFVNSTFSWWAAFLSGASHVAPFEPWKPNKGRNSKNLGHTDLPGWQPWGSAEDLYWGKSR